MFTDGFFKGNGFIYNINQDRTKVRLLKAFETREDGSNSNFNENAEMTFHSNENRQNRRMETKHPLPGKKIKYDDINP